MKNPRNDSQQARSIYRTQPLMEGACREDQPADETVLVAVVVVMWWSVVVVVVETVQEVTKHHIILKSLI